MKRLLIAALLLAPLPALADQITLDDGTIVNGELVDYQGGVYTVKIGKFMKSIPERRVVDVRAVTAGAAGDSGAAPAADSAPAAPAAPAAPNPMIPAPGSPRTPVTGSLSDRPAPATSSPARAARSGGIGSTPIPRGPSYAPGTARAVPNAPGAAGAVPSLQQIQDSMKRINAAPNGVDPGIAGVVQKMMGGNADMSDLQGLQNNPEMQKMVERFGDPNYQKQLLDGLGDMQQQSNPGQPNPMIDQLRGLFDQLNAQRGRR